MDQSNDRKFCEIVHVVKKYFRDVNASFLIALLRIQQSIAYKLPY